MTDMVEIRLVNFCNVYADAHKKEVDVYFELVPFLLRCIAHRLACKLLFVILDCTNLEINCATIIFGRFYHYVDIYLELLH